MQYESNRQMIRDDAVLVVEIMERSGTDAFSP
jgi:hypothetical protein